MDQRLPTSTRSWPRPVLYAIPLAIVGGLVALYLVAPDFYVRLVLSELNREYQVVEIATFGCAISAAVMLGIAAWRLWRAGAAGVGRAGAAGGRRSGAVIIGIIGAAAFFFAGEEISWGQTYIGWSTPDAYRPFAVETNLHNTEMPIRLKTLGSLFLVMMFFVLPAAWRLDRSRKLPRGWRPAIPEGPVIFCMAVGFAWREAKIVYRFLNPDWRENRDAHEWYWGFLDQCGEHKELLVAVALLMYGVYRIRNGVRTPL